MCNHADTETNLWGVVECRTCRRQIRRPGKLTLYSADVFVLGKRIHLQAFGPEGLGQEQVFPELKDRMIRGV